MHHLELTSEELEILGEILRHHLTDMNVEVFRTDTREFKDMLKHRRDVLEQVLGKLTSAPTTAQ